jgi:ABC-type bacteriocin/lantibiotic exporter with double-glycine peptidase domain
LSETALLPRNIFLYVIGISRLHQVALVILTVSVFLLEVVPLELQRRAVNDIVKNRSWEWVGLLCLVYFGAVLLQGGIKLVLNIYRGWVGERAKRDLRRRVHAVIETPDTEIAAEAGGIAASMIVAEVEPIGGFVGESLSEPLLQGGILASVLAYMVHLDPWMALSALAIFVPQLVFVPLMQAAINRRTAARVWILRELSIGVVAHANEDKVRLRNGDVSRIDRVFELEMGIFKIKFTMNFLMNLCTHFQIIAALLIGGWLVLTQQLEIGGVVAFISGVGRLNDPWGDLVNYFRDANAAQVKYELLATAVNQLTENGAVTPTEERQPRLRSGAGGV